MKFKILQVYPNYIEANIVLSRLKDDGINCWLKDEFTSTITPFFSQAIGGIKIMVAWQDFDKAWNLLQEYDSILKKNNLCPNCQSNNVEYISSTRKTKNWLMAIIGYLAGDYAISSSKMFHCFDCGFEYEPNFHKLESH